MLLFEPIDLDEIIFTQKCAFRQRNHFVILPKIAGDAATKAAKKNIPVVEHFLGQNGFQSITQSHGLKKTNTLRSETLKISFFLKLLNFAIQSFWANRKYFSRTLCVVHTDV